MAVEKERAKHDSGTVGAETQRVQGRAHPGTKAARAAVRLLTVQRNNSIVMTVWWMISCLVSVGNKAIRENRRRRFIIMGGKPADLWLIHKIARSVNICPVTIESRIQQTSTNHTYCAYVLVLVLQTDKQPHSTYVPGFRLSQVTRNRNEVFWAIPGCCRKMLNFPEVKK